MRLKLDPGAAVLLDALHAAGYRAYAVGGCVRDSLMGLVPHDWDLCTSALPQQVVELFGAERCIPTGLQHGTVTVRQNGGLYEITTFRTDGTYTDGRHPDEVHFVPDVREDLARRDFTINAMACNEKEGLIDPFGGQSDLHNGIVRAVGVPRKRFEEDALRILRLYRFAARFGFAIDPATAQAAQALCEHLDCVSSERIEEELSKLLAAPKPGAYLNEDVMAVILPELTPEALAQAKPVVDACPADSGLPVRLAALLVSLGETSTRKALKRLRCSNALIDETAVLVREEERGVRQELSPQTRNTGCGTQHLFRCRSHLAGRCPNSSSLFPPQAAVTAVAGHSIARPSGRPSEEAPGTPDQPSLTINVRRLLGRYDLKTVQRLAALGTALQPEHAADFEALSKLAERLEADGVCCRISQLAVNGRDLMAAGIPAGAGLRKVLEELLEGVIREEYPNEKQTLLAQAKKFSAS